MRTWALIVNVVASLVVLAPATEAFGDRKWDTFPLSWYPMFSDPRNGTETPRYVIGLTPEGERHLVDYRYWTSGGFNQGSMQLKKLERERKGGLKKLCPKIASRVARRNEPRLAEVDQIRIVRGTYSPIAYFRDGDTKPMKERVMARCPVPR